MREWLWFMGPAYVIVVPAIGGAFVGPMIYFFAREAKGHGVPEMMEAVALRGGRLRPIVVVIKSLASSICIGSGGSVGREGSIVQIGSALGPTLGQLLKLSDERIRNLVVCGAAAGIAATFNAPTAGVIFTDSDGDRVEMPLDEAWACDECLVAFGQSGRELHLVMPGQPVKSWVKNLVIIEIQ